MKKLIIAALAALSLAIPTTAGAQSTPSVLGLFASSAANYTTISGIGFNTVTTSASITQLDNAAAHGLKSLVWLGGYRNEPTCQFRENDAWVTEHVNRVKNHPAVLGYQIDNEPHATQCKNAPAQIRARNALVKSLDPNHVTMLAVYRDYEFDDYANATDVLRVGMYPCSHASGCRFNRITEKVNLARQVGWTQLWGSPQAFGNSYYRLPTPVELQTILDTWRAAGVPDLVAYQWDQGEPVVLSQHPELWPAFGG